MWYRNDHIGSVFKTGDKWSWAHHERPVTMPGFPSKEHAAKDLFDYHKQHEESD